MDLIMGIDIGTSKTAVSMVDPNKYKIIKTVEEETPYLPSEEPWRREQSPIKIATVIRTLIKNTLNEADRIVAIGITGQMHGILGLDANGKPITNFVTWQDDRGNIPIEGEKSLIQEISEKAGDLNTNGIASGFGLVTLYYWLKTGIKPHKISTITDYIGMLLTCKNKVYIDPTMAESLGCLDVEKGRWKKDFLKALNIPINILPELIESTKVIGETSGKGFFDLLKDKIPVVVSIGDNQASFLGSVKYYTDTILLNIGTGAQISIAEESYQKASSLPFIDGIDVQIRPFIENKYLVAGNAISGGVVYKTLFNFFKNVGTEFFGISNFDNLYKKMEESASRIFEEWEIGKKYNIEEMEKLEVYPLFAGKRSSPNMRGWIRGIGLTNLKPSNLVLETLKGMVKILTEMFDQDIINRKNYLVGSGNGIRRNILLQRILEDMVKKRLSICKYSEEAVVGAIINAGVATGIYKSFDEASNLIDYGFIH